MFLPRGVMLIDRYASSTANVRSASGAVRQTRYHQQDRLGSTVAVTDEAGAVIERQFYDPWGQRRNGDGSPSASLRSLDHRHGYTGHEHIDAVGLVNMNGRVYDPTIGRFMSADPTVPDPSDGQQYNRYSYVVNNPNGYVDPSGYTPLEADTVLPPAGMGLGLGDLLGAAGITPMLGGMDSIATFGGDGRQQLQTIEITGRKLACNDNCEKLKALALLMEREARAMSCAGSAALAACARMQAQVRAAATAIRAGSAALVKQGSKLLVRTGVGTVVTVATVGIWLPVYAVQSGQGSNTSVENGINPELHTWAVSEEGSNVRENNSKGKKAEDEVASDLEGEGRRIERQVRKDTPFGPRVIDIEVKDKDGNVLGGVEVKSGDSRYRQDQRSKDEWLRQNGYPVDVVRKP
jgi:RHS repeat-associated protein